jgi:hypothetical protein
VHEYENSVLIDHMYKIILSMSYSFKSDFHIVCREIEKTLKYYSMKYFR